MVVGVYWKQRPESREKAAERLGAFLRGISNISEFSEWYLKGRSLSRAHDVPVPRQSRELAQLFRTKRAELGNQEILELGFGLGIWNGHDASISLTVGADSPYIQNAIVLASNSVSTEVGDEAWRGVLEAAVEAFDPDRGIVAIDAAVADSPGARNLSDIAWLTYDRTAGMVVYPDRR